MDISDVEPLINKSVRTRDGAEVGEVSAIHALDGSTKAVFIEIKAQGQTYRFVVPIIRASMAEDRIELPYTLRQVLHGPRVSGDDDVLTMGQSVAAFDHYHEDGIKRLDRSQATGRKGKIDETLDYVKRLPPRITLRPS
jgi:spore germination protein GerM